MYNKVTPDDELNNARFMWVRMQLRRYYNEVMEIEEAHDEEEMTHQEAEKALQLLDDKYATIITKDEARL